MPLYDCGDKDCEECQRAFGPNRERAIKNYEAREAYYATLQPSAPINVPSQMQLQANELSRKREKTMHTVTESIYSGQRVTIPLADVQHIEATNEYGITIVTKHTRWDADAGGWANGIWIDSAEANAFKAAWCRYRSELEANDLADLSPNEFVRDNAQFGVGA